MNNDSMQALKLSEKFNYPPSIIERFLKRYGKRTIKILSVLKTPSKNFTIRVNTLKITTKNLLDKLKKLSIDVKKHEIIPDAIMVPWKGPFKIPILEKQIVIDKFAAESVVCGSDLYIPGIRSFNKFREGDTVTILNEKKLPVALGMAKINYKDLSAIRKGVAFETIKSIYSIPNLKYLKVYEDGLFYNQSLPAIVASHVLDPHPREDELIVDLCAGVGGKSTHIAQLMKNKGKIIAIDRSKNKIEKLKENMYRLGITNMRIIIGDSKILLPEFEHSADRVLIDPPCSALGVRPKLFETKTERDIISSAEYQKYFIHIANKIVKPGGFMVYSTCTFSPEENEMNVRYMIEKFNLKIIEQKMYIGSRGENIDDKISHNLLQRFYPDLHETPGFFIAKLRSPNNS